MALILDEMDILGADGVDFVPVDTKKDDVFKNVLQSNTRDEFNVAISCPKSMRLYWKIVDGKKVYL